MPASTPHRSVNSHEHMKQSQPLNGASSRVVPEVEDVGHKVLGSIL